MFCTVDAIKPYTSYQCRSQADIAKALGCSTLHCRTFCRAHVPHTQQCFVNVETVPCGAATVCQGPRAAMSRCRGVPSSSTVDVSRVRVRRWIFAKLSLLPGSKSVWADGQTEESAANPAPAGSATFSLVQSSTGQIILSLLKAFRKNQGKMNRG